MEFTNLPLQTRIKINQRPFHNNEKKTTCATNAHDNPLALILAIKL